MTTELATWIGKDDPPEAFPDVSRALAEPDGLLAAGGDLSPERLLYAYQRGIFPWYDEGQPILWWSPNPRCVFYPGAYRVSKRLRRDLKKHDATVSFNRAFNAVVEACAGPRAQQDGTWITTDIMTAYARLHELGWAHSVEIWRGDRLIGGMYGLAIGKAFFGESMFSREDNGSKLALLSLCSVLREHQFEILDCQVVSEHLLTLGAVAIPREDFTAILARACEPAESFACWPQELLPIQAFGPAAPDASLQ
ncbi:MAG TPA: leucyl/phenylalanyl-tRNA--protein transferase [Woeseiaceae bacterium]|nr:leucyl/phenylalanyl-tRNA--protein transferase [Woeseiaceae bacterium]